ncbi:hypothetical protein BDZ45DRAFT_434936 [Acephala macrosclerotiorum]|nr:hypothetical protein BDZ45DRAFT_434936 [Acephala macrosclerotiorum]
MLLLPSARSPHRTQASSLQQDILNAPSLLCFSSFATSDTLAILFLQLMKTHLNRTQQQQAHNRLSKWKVLHMRRDPLSINIRCSIAGSCQRQRLFWQQIDQSTKIDQMTWEELEAPVACSSLFHAPLKNCDDSKGRPSDSVLYKDNTFRQSACTGGSDLSARYISRGHRQRLGAGPLRLSERNAAG